MSIVRKDEFAAHLGVSSTPTRAQACIDAAEAAVASYLSIFYNRRGNPLQQHTVSERITPVRDKTFLEVSCGPVTGIESIAYNITGFRKTGDEVDDDFSTETPTFEYVFSPDYGIWSVSGRTSNGSGFVFQRGVEYRVTYRTGWCAGNVSDTWQWFRTSDADVWDDNNDRLGWGFVDGTAAQKGGGDRYFFGPQPTTDEEGISYETGSGDITDERLLSPALTVSGADYPFVITRLNLIRASTAGYPCYKIGWLDGDGRTYFTGKKTERSNENFLPDRIRASALNDDHTGYTNLVADMGFNPASEIESQTQDPVRSWIDNTITQISLKFWNLGTAADNGALFTLDYVMICDGTTRIPSPVKIAVLETAKAIRDGSSSGVMTEGIGDYSKMISESESSRVIPPLARQLINPYRRPSW